MKCIGLLSLLFCIYTAKAQKNRYFPQEQLVLAPCEDAADLPNCTYDHIERKVFTFLGANKKRLKKFENDTIRCSATVIVDINGDINKNKSKFNIGPKNINPKLQKKLKNVFDTLSIIKVLFHKQNGTSKHFFDFNYAISKIGAELTLDLISNKNQYAGGVIEEVPIFPGCEDLDNQDSLLCFQKKMQDHIKNTFQYPELALKNGIQGKVAVVFVITKEGTIANIRTKGPDQLLEKEATRMVKLLPKIAPAKHNGVPVKVPFSIPIFFKL